MRLVRFRWEDSQLPQGWRDPAELVRLEPVEVDQVGFLVHESERSIVIASGYHDDQVVGIVVIPRRSLLTPLAEIS